MRRFPRRRPAFASGVALAAGLLLGAASGPLGCGGPEVRTYDVKGVVRDVDAAEGQILVEHEEVPDLMPAMTMNFDVPRPEILEGVQKGDAIEFRLRYDGTRLQLVALRSIGARELVGTGISLAGLAGRRDPAPPFVLVDQDGAQVSLEDLRGQALVVDFIFTHCPGPCPVLTGILRDVQQALPAELRGRVHFVSITVDPERDRPEVLRAYARARGADLSDWSFLTGEPERVREVLRGWGVSSQAGEGGNVDHLVATFLVDPQGRIAERYLGTQHTPQELLEDLERILS